MPPNDRIIGIWRSIAIEDAVLFTVVERQSECWSKTAGMHVSQL